MKQQPFSIKRFFTVSSIVLFVVVQIVGVFAFAQPAQAVFAGATVWDPAGWEQRERHHQGDKVSATVSESLLSAVMGSLLHATSYFTRKLAYDTALYVAYGGKGQGALAFQDGPGAYFEKVALDSAADAIGELGKPFGLNLCQIPDIRLNAYLQVGLAGYTGVSPQPNCRWQDLRNGGLFDGDAWKQRYGTEEGLAETFSTTLSVNNTDFGVALGAIGAVNDRTARAEASARQERTEGEGFKPVSSLISGDIKTPAQIVKEETTALTAKHQGELSAGQIAGIYGSGLKQVPAMAASVFLNTLTGTLLNRLLTEGLFPESTDGSREYRAGAFSYDSSPFGGRNDARNAYNFLFTIKPEQLSNYPIIAEFAACPDNPGLNNCVIDTNLQRAFAQAQANDAVTIQEALDLGYLNENWPLISPRHRAHSSIQDCQVGRYCYSNIQKLRKVRALPLGFEIAALRSDPDNPWTLGQVVQGFDNCKRDPDDPTKVVADPEFPFCHLINPNWIVAIPNARCNSNVYGPQLTTQNIATRRKECVDISSCLAKGPNGECVGYGYCTKEENIWKIDADTCPSYYNTCDTYINAEDRSVSSYLSRTLDFGQCNEDNAGCRAYSLTKFNADEWRPSTIAGRDLYKAVGRNEEIYFNGKVTGASGVCDADSDGCRAYIPAQQYSNGLYVKDEDNNFVQNTEVAPLYLQRAPDYLGCYDVNRNNASPELNWPTTLQEVNNLVSQDERCDAFASVCIEDEVGCASYEPVEGGVAIPGIIGEQNSCDASCNGYDTFKQLSYEDAGQGFEDEAFPLYFIPSAAEASMQANGQVCNAEYVGCDEFTNLDVAAAGGEGLEYYSSLTYCEKPLADGSNSKVFYSWEGSLREGFVLRTHRVKPIDQRDLDYIRDTLGNDGNGTYDTGLPMYADDSNSSLASAAAVCNEASYNAKINDPEAEGAAPEDCHALYDEDGNVSYRLVSELVFVSDLCHAIRKTTPEVFQDNTIGAASCSADRGEWDAATNSCTRCVNGGEYRNGACIYFTISEPGLSSSCPANANQCRAYAGNTAGNTVNIFTHNFEPNGEDDDALLDAREGWIGFGNGASVRVVSEATDVGLHSLLLEQGSAMLALSPTNTPGLAGNSFYEFSLWARGSGALDIRIAQGGDILARFDAVGVGNAWNRYRVGPVEIGSLNEEELVQIILTQRDGQNRQVFVDTLVLTRVQDLTYLIKDSWKTVEGYDAPVICDANPQDGIPGAALGCRAYQETNNKGLVRYATGFEQLCREKAVGCTPVWDTYNTVEGTSPETAHVYNLWCAGDEGAECQLILNDQLFGSCIVPRGERGCYARLNNSLDIALPPGMDYNDIPDAWLIDASVYVPADTPSTTPMFLANKDEHRCRDTELGCQLIGREEQVVPDDNSILSFTHQDVMVKNDPALYNDILCSDDLVGCSEFNKDGAQFYFKDPRYTGNTLCEYRPYNKPGEPFGWFLKDQNVGSCSLLGDLLCTDDSDCPGEQNTCINQGTIACYPDYLERGGEHGLWGNGSDRYNGYVGSCEAQFNNCTEIVDTADTSNVHPDGQPYYLVFNSKVQNKLDECTSVGLRDGCVLFDQTDNPNKIYNTQATYALSETQDPPYGLVDPITAPTEGVEDSVDANLILKVDRERQCSEWLECKTYIPTIDDSGEQTYLCAQYAACEQFSDDGQCTSWVNDVATPEDRLRATQRLTFDNYVERDVSWYDEDFSGYSLYNKYQITNMQQLAFNFDTLTEEEQRFMEARQQQTYITRVVDNRLFRYAEADDLDCNDSTVTSTDWLACGLDAQGLCYKRKCFYPIDNEFTDGVIDKRDVNDIANAIDQLTPNSCKGFPEEDSPFPTSIVPASGVELREGINGTARKIFTESRPSYANINVCQDGNCSCEYQKVTYDNGDVDYIGITDEPVPGICSGGDSNTKGKPCTSDIQCSGADDEPGTCHPIDDSQQVFGLRGFCLEYDFSRRSPINDSQFECLTWLPVEVSVGRADIHNSEQTAGYLPRVDASGGYGQLYCPAADTFREFEQDEQNRIDRWFTLVNHDEPESETVFPPGGVQSCQVDNCVVQGGFGGACPPSEFHLSCGSEGDAGLSDDFITTWSRKHLDISAELLRQETPLQVRGAVDGSYYNVHGNIENYSRVNGGNQGGGCGSGDDDGSPACTIYSFAPVGFNNVVDYGTVMHPPRYWDTPERDVLNCNVDYCIEIDCPENPNGDYNHRCIEECVPENPPPGYRYYDSANIEGCGFGYSSFTYRTQAGRIVATHPMSPERAVRNHRLFNEERDTYLLENKLLDRFSESGLVEQEVNRIHFLVTGYPHGAEGINPGLMNKELYIDFLALQNTGFDHRRNTVPVTGNIGNDRGVFFPRTDNNAADASVYTALRIYDRDAGVNHNDSYNSYDDLAAMSGSLAAFKDDPRNQIHKRYVMVYHTGRPHLDNQDLMPEGIYTDMFDDRRQACVAGTSNWFAIGMDFNKDGEFLGYISRFCAGQDQDGDEDGDHGIQFAVVATRNLECIEVQEVHKSTGVNPLEDTSNKAWTNRLWEGALVSHPTNGYRGNRAGVPLREQESMPFGSLPIRSAGIELNQPLSVKHHYFAMPDRDGIPYSCGNGGSCQLLRNQNTRRAEAAKYDAAVVSVLNEKTKDDAVSAVHQLFAQAFSISTKVQGQGLTAVQAGEDRAFQFGTNNGRALPQIYSVNPAECAAGAARCSAAEPNAFSVGERNGTLEDYDGDGVRDEDADRDGSPDAIIETSGSYVAQLRFFAFADDDRMPIRRVMIDWGDDGELTNEIVKGLYKNRKPICESSDAAGQPEVGICVTAAGTPTGVTCDPTHQCPIEQECLLPVEIENRVQAGTLPAEYGNKQFGDLPRACHPGYFEYLHEYVCNESDVRDHAEAVAAGRVGLPFVRTVGSLADSERLNALGLENNEYVCAFQPKVQVMDNWGWCNGECVRDYGVADGQIVGIGNRTEGCYDGRGPGLLEQQCSNHTLPGHSPWTAYKNVVIVVPPELSDE